MKKSIMYLFARTPVHVGAGNSVGVVDSPVMRERHTRIPIIPGSSLKGVLSDLWNDENFQRTADGKDLFGEDNDKADAKAGKLLVGEARVLAFPVRSAKGMFAWITCPLVLRRFKRESNLEFDVPDVAEMQALAGSELVMKEKVVLEEYVFSVTSAPDETILNALVDLFDDDVWTGVKKQLVVVSDEMMQHFCEHACAVVTRIKIDDKTGVVASGALFNQEQVPSETLFYAPLSESKAGNLEKLNLKLAETSTIQVGGDETIGLGVCSVVCKEVE